MRHLFLVFLPIFLWAQSGFEISNGYIRLQLGDKPSLSFDPTGKGRYGENIAKDFLPNWFVSPPESVDKEKHRLVFKGLVYCNPARIEVGNQFAELLENTLGQSFHLHDFYIKRIEVLIPTWGRKDSCVTLTLKRNNPKGEVIVSKRLENVPDNSWQGFSFSPPLPPGDYYIEMSQPKGMIGWWSSRESFPQGEAYTNDTPKPDVDRAIRIEGWRKVGEADLSFTLRRNELLMEGEIKGESSNIYFPLSTPWKKSGYDVSRESGVLFSRFFTSLGQYYPIEQLKRRDHSDPNLISCDWIRATGTGNYDLQFSAQAISLSWTMEEDTMHFHFYSLPSHKAEITLASFKITVFPHSDWLPDFFPRFRSSDPKLDALLNRFYYERAFTYPPGGGGSPTWKEWDALIRDWTCSPLKEGEKRNLESIRIDDDGYVYTWGDIKGWPLGWPQYDSRHFDTCAKLILAVWRWYCWTKDEDFLLKQIGKLRMAMNYQLKDLQGEKEGIIITNSRDVMGRCDDQSSNYWDILPFGYRDGYCSIYFYASLQAMKEIEGLLEKRGIKGERYELRHPPSYYEDLMRKAKEAYARNFWDEEKGRFIGCIDVNGVKHDYGFTFLNLEALTYGLGDEEKAKRIFHWMETEPTSSGLPDTYSKWIFAPRANTIHNPMRNEPQEPYPSWWVRGWFGTPYGDQCQDGGAILYTSFYDLMARAKYLGADNAYKRFWEILKRYSMPDKLCGGPPLFRGEIPQQENPGQVGVDLPFPESGLVPTFFIYGIMGINADVEGLKIKPNLPSALKFAEVENLCYGNLPLKIRVTKNTVEIICEKKGYEFHIKRKLKPGEEFVFSSLPGGKRFPPIERSAWKAKWIWKKGEENKPGTICFRKSFILSSVSKPSFLYITADNYYELYINDKFVGKNGVWETVEKYDVSGLLKKGKNTIAVKCRNEEGPAGLLVELTAGKKGKVILFSDESWKAGKEEEGWEKINFNDSHWQNAEALGSPPCQPWGELKKR
ncbi:MAG: GH116 family glycosyl hydrolase [bacterium]